MLELWNELEHVSYFEIDVLLQFSLRMHFSKNAPLVKAGKPVWS